MMALEAHDLTTLKAFFPPNQHEFLSGNAYITEGAITDRIEEIDPSWTFEILDVSHRENQVITNARMTIKGVSRDGVGMAPLTVKTKEGKIIDGADPEKSAATDALKRCARLFGIGRYLLSLDGVKNTNDLAAWLKRNSQQSKAAPTAPPLQFPTNGNGSQPQTNGNTAMQPEAQPLHWSKQPVAWREFCEKINERFNYDANVITEIDWAKHDQRSAYLAVRSLAEEKNWPLIARKATYTPAKDGKGGGMIEFDTDLKTRWYEGRTKLADLLQDQMIKSWTEGEHEIPAVIVTWEAKDGYRLAKQVEHLPIPF